MSRELTEIQKKILEHLIDQIKGKGIPPTLAEVARHFGYKNRATVQQHLAAIEKKGYIRKNPRLSRGRLKGKVTSEKIQDYHVE